MESKEYIAIFIIGMLMVWTGCKKPYMPPAITTASNYLVVEGVINTGPDSTIIRLSRTVPLSSSAGTTPEAGATVAVESDANTSYPLTETGNGHYVTAGLNLSSSNKYRLKITTSDNKAYQSDFVAVKNSQPIDSVNYTVNGNGVEVNVSSHDPSNNTKYYRWDYNETWIIHSAYYSSEMLVKNPDTILYRPATNQIYTCWTSAASNDIVLGSTAKLSRDVIVNTPIAFVPSTSEKVGVRYSILVKQYALTPDAFNYWQQLRKITEQLGGIFDPQPSEITGNIHCITIPSEPVIGYISAGQVSQKRIFIDNKNLPAWSPITPNAGCYLDTLLYQRPIGPNVINEVAETLYTGFQIPVTSIGRPNSTVILGFLGSTPDCVDCTLRGTNKQPDFWK